MVVIEVVSVSVFYNQSLWHRLLRDMLSPYLKGYDLIACRYSLFFSQERGDHVTILIESPKSWQTEADFSEKVKSYLAEYPGNEKEIQLPVRTFFMDYPTNTFLSDFENFADVSFVKKNDIRIRESISLAMLGAFESDEVDLESICSFLICMLFGTIKAAFPQWDDVLLNISDLFKCLDEFDDSTSAHVNGRTVKVDQTELTLFFSNNFQVVFQMIDMLWPKITANVDLDWLNVWISNIKSFIDIENPAASSISICQMLYVHLGINDHHLKSRFTFYLLKVVETGIKN
ncbi:hypothetical protein SAMN05192574_101833 [Mucilaginibacter gossypiicola]|uniref:Thiopeptide-type bacteriocin biosynthesis domain-containing protein n=1 Tax=Mucilaginibacter gossypiicola TaxID=551995 RepID=A0A1H8BBA3_9SPHI|nr:hypothetical protein [Mucilaginibacter gossypiicola]SEM79394.1 hypothetical protein SAMN05192574_101833 [Mucilaginibacter gossypiicola]